jgi:enamine deaminase RidA (YjgF/YER057c/UK114 family)
VSLEQPQRFLVLSGLLGVHMDGSVPKGAGEQTRLILEGIEACLVEAGMERAHVVRLTTFLIDVADRQAYMEARNAWVADPPPASTLVVVKALVNPACRVEIEAIAAA